MEEREKKTIVVRGVEEETYRRIAELARRMNKTIGEIVNQAFRTYLSIMEVGGRVASQTLEAIRDIGETIRGNIARFVEVENVIRDFEELTISKSDLEYATQPLVFMNIGKLVFEDGISKELFKEKVGKIVNCDYVEVPSSIPKMLVASKCRLVKKLKIRGK